MPRPRKNGRIYERKRGGVTRYYGDFRDYADVGGKQEALIPDGARSATSDPDEADELAAERLLELKERRIRKRRTGIEEVPTLKKYAAAHLKKKARGTTVSDQWLASEERHLNRAIAFIGAGTPLDEIGVDQVEKFTHYLLEEGGERTRGLEPASVRQHLNSISNLYRRAQSEKVVPLGYNPVGAMMDKPQPAKKEAHWFEADIAALILEAAKRYEPAAEAISTRLAYPLIATYLLTGGRKNEVLGLDLEEISFDRKRITFRPNRWRTLKTASAHRSVRMWPQLETILREYVFGGNAPASGLLFPSDRSGELIWSIDKTLDNIGRMAGLQKGELRCHTLRHTFCAARLQTLDRGHPVSPFTVSRELGHGGDALVKKVYGHLGEVRHRSEEVEFRAEQHEDSLGERLAALRAWTPAKLRCKGSNTADEPCQEYRGLNEQGLCLWHDPARRERAKQAREKHRRGTRRGSKNRTTKHAGKSADKRATCPIT